MAADYWPGTAYPCVRLNRCRVGFPENSRNRLPRLPQALRALGGTPGPQVLARTDKLYKAPEPTALKKGDFVRIASDDNALPETMRWEYGKVVKVHGGK